ncbi:MULTISPECIES: hypothetical protein [unclassified Nostoc]|uniref:hypothetical protein n=1 Tax=unclassified Nostoc TaxID=2593658 RepID=UPI002AD39223|nr:hypothetical protein [Nostoc sp. DedQUE03]MDZ7975266.1 hypothetical protein [Nostoc sp. DedQUE03]MDZ8048881.1 hypothetical protein [Nostoc sp. DedQUE02]
MLGNNDLQDRWIPRYFRLAIANILSNLMVPLSGMVSVSFLGHLQDIRHDFYNLETSDRRYCSCSKDSSFMKSYESS